MHVSQARLFQHAFRLSPIIIRENPVVVPKKSDKLLIPAAFVLATIGVGLSSYSVKQMLNTPKASKKHFS